MHIRDIDYELPESRIAQRPVEPRDSAKLLVDRGGDAPVDSTVARLCDFLREGDVLVVNDTRVLPARLRLQRRSGGAAEVLLLECTSSDGAEWEALVRPARKLREFEILEYFGRPVVKVGQRTTAGDTFLVTLLDEAPRDWISRVGTMPLPPYIRSDLVDRERYQTVYAERAASAAAPTAGLHFTTELLESVRSMGVKTERVELVVGLDTFKPVTAENPRDHKIHTEMYSVNQSVLDACRSARRVVAVGTTATRALESAITRGELNGRTDLFITRGYEWKVVDVLLTNFHMPRTSLLLLIHAFVGDRWRRLYDYALTHDYRFLSFGDAMLLDRHAEGD